MADVKIRNLNDWIVESLRTRARNAGHSLEQELRQVLTDSALSAKREAAVVFKALREEMRGKHGLLPDSTDLIREDREERG